MKSEPTSESRGSNFSFSPFIWPLSRHRSHFEFARFSLFTPIVHRTSDFDHSTMDTQSAHCDSGCRLARELRWLIDVPCNGCCGCACLLINFASLNSLSNDAPWMQVAFTVSSCDVTPLFTSCSGVFVHIIKRSSHLFLPCETNTPNTFGSSIYTNTSLQP